MIVDPAIHYQPGSFHHSRILLYPNIIFSPTGYAPYDVGMQQGVFLRDASNNTFVGKVWPGLTVFPDWFNPGTSSYWSTQISEFLQGVPLDGLWIDMNEASNFCDGECVCWLYGGDDYYYSHLQFRINPRMPRSSALIRITPLMTSTTGAANFLSTLMQSALMQCTMEA